MRISRKDIQELKQKLLKSKTNNNAVFTTLGATSHALSKRQKHDYYATDPIAAELLMSLERFSNILEHVIASDVSSIMTGNEIRLGN